MPELYILLPVHNRREITRRLIECLKRQTFRDFRVVLIDDGSTDGTAEMVKENISSLAILRGEGNWWWGGALQQGYLWLKSQALPDSAMVLILNDDAVFEDDYLEIGRDALKQTNRTLIVSVAYAEGTSERLDGGVRADWMRWKFFLELDPQKIDCASTRGLFLFARDFVALGGFHPVLLPHYASDYEFTIRAHKRGYRLLVDERLRLVSNEKATGVSHFREEQSYANFLKTMFSKKYNLNPFYLSSFVAFACPWKWKWLNWARIWSSTLWKIIRYFFKLVLLKYIW